MTRRTLTLTEAERRALERKARSDPEPSMRRRCQAILLVADGHAPYWVARRGLTPPATPETVYVWLNRYEREGIGGLAIRPGRGRKPNYFPSETVDRMGDGAPDVDGIA